MHTTNKQSEIEQPTEWASECHEPWHWTMNNPWRWMNDGKSSNSLNTPCSGSICTPTNNQKSSCCCCFCCCCCWCCAETCWKKEPDVFDLLPHSILMVKPQEWCMFTQNVVVGLVSLLWPGCRYRFAIEDLSTEIGQSCESMITNNLAHRFVSFLSLFNLLKCAWIRVLLLASLSAK